MHLDDGMHGILIPKCWNHPKKPPGTKDLDKAGYMVELELAPSVVPRSFRPGNVWERVLLHLQDPCVISGAGGMSFYHKNIIHHKWFKRCFIGLGQEYIKLTSIEGCTRIS